MAKGSKGFILSGCVAQKVLKIGYSREFEMTMQRQRTEAKGGQTSRKRIPPTQLVVQVDTLGEIAKRFTLPAGYKITTNKENVPLGLVHVSVIKLFLTPPASFSGEAAKKRYVGFIHRAHVEAGATEERLYPVENIFARMDVLTGDPQDGYYLLKNTVPEKTTAEVE